MQVYNEKEQIGHKKMQNVQFEDKKSKVCAERNKEINKKLEWNKGKGTLRTRPLLAKFQTCIRKRPKELTKASINMIQAGS